MTISADHQSRWFDLDLLLEKTFVRKIEFHRECVSTNDLALSTSTEWQSPSLVLTDTQTGGRGRGGNQWWARDGALTYSIRLKPADYSVTHERWPLISLTTAIAVADTLQLFTSNHKASSAIGLKWPNDVFLNQKKVSGILVEPPTGSTSEIVIGIGINIANTLANAPDEVRTIATSILDETGIEFSPCDVLLSFLQRFEALLRELGSSTLSLKERWQSQCMLTGCTISLKSGDHQVSGFCRGIADNGAILVETDGSVRSWFGGVVRFQD